MKMQSRGVERERDLRAGRRTLIILALFGMLALGFADASTAAETQRPKGQGTLTEVRGNGTVVIQERTIGEEGSQGVRDRGYLLSPRALILDHMGKKTTLHKFMMPAVVEFEYLYTPNGPEIRLIREVAQ